jgi:hypothetical protein
MQLGVPNFYRATAITVYSKQLLEQATTNESIRNIVTDDLTASMAVGRLSAFLYIASIWSWDMRMLIRSPRR